MSLRKNVPTIRRRKLFHKENLKIYDSVSFNITIKPYSLILQYIIKYLTIEYIMVESPHLKIILHSN